MDESRNMRELLEQRHELLVYLYCTVRASRSCDGFEREVMERRVDRLLTELADLEKRLGFEASA